MSFLNHKIKLLLSLVGIANHVSAQVQSDQMRSVPNQSIELNQLEQQSLQGATPRIYQIITEDELINAIQSNNLDLLLLKKGILIKKHSADSTVCEKCTNGKQN